jgi:hypothetical protein
LGSIATVAETTGATACSGAISGEETLPETPMSIADWPLKLPSEGSAAGTSDFVVARASDAI